MIIDACIQCAIIDVYGRNYNEHTLLYMCLCEGVSDDNILERVNTRIKVRVYTCGS